jgi:pimeloyl-ACP methyl ester carboxylesterase
MFEQFHQPALSRQASKLLAPVKALQPLKALQPSKLRRTSWALGLSVVVGALAASALWNKRAEKRAETRNPPQGRMIDVDGVPLQLLDTGGFKPAVLLIHGNAVTSADMEISGLIDALKDRYRVIAFDRPGYGYSERPRDRSWTPEAQADLFAKALAQMQIEKAVVFGHSWGALVAAAYGLRHPHRVNGLVLASGSYFPTLRSDALLAAIGAAPALGDILRRTISPLVGRLMAPAAFAAMFAPLPVPERFKHSFPASLLFRATQLRASSEEGTMMIPAEKRFSSLYGAMKPPVTIIAGDADKIVDPQEQSAALRDAIPGSVLVLLPGVGHMTHYAATAKVAAAIDELATRVEPLAAE